MAYVDLEKARVAKDHLANALQGDPAVHAIGLTPDDNGFALLVYLFESGAEARVPTEVDGVEVRVDITGFGEPEQV